VDGSGQRQGASEHQPVVAGPGVGR
jgi:hypothetical protein